MSHPILLVSGSLRAASTTGALLHTATALAPDALLFDGVAALPHFNPDDDHPPLPPPVAALREQIHAARALLFATPEYAGALPGSFKNLLDWTIGDDANHSINGKPVGWVNASPRGAVEAHAELRRVLTYAGARIVEAACIDVPVTAAEVGADGRIDDAMVVERLTAALAHLRAAAPVDRAGP